MDIRDPEVVNHNEINGFLALVAELEWGCLDSDGYNAVVYPAQSSTAVSAVTLNDKYMTLEPVSCAEKESPRSVQWVTPRGEEQSHLLEGQAVPCGVGSAFSKQPPELKQSIEFTARDHARWEAMMPFIDTVCTLQRPYRWIDCAKDARKEVSNAVNFTGNLWFSDWKDKDGRVLNTFFGFARSGDVRIPKAKSRLLRVLEIALPMIYGGLHLTWTSELPTPLESMLWKISCGVVAGGLLMGWAIQRTIISPMKIRLGLLFGQKVANNTQGSLFWGIMVFIFSIYVTARGFIVVESFISLRAMPIGVFVTPAWLQMIPHL